MTKKTIRIPLLRQGPTKNKKMVVTEEIFNDVLRTYNPERVHVAPIVKAGHEDQKSGFGTRAGEALGYIAGLDTETINGASWIIGEVEPADEESEEELLRLLKGPMKFNSVEVDYASKIEADVYGPDRTAVFPDDAKERYHLRRVNLMGATPIAQFGMPVLMNDSPMIVLQDINDNQIGDEKKMNIKEPETPSARPWYFRKGVTEKITELMETGLSEEESYQSIVAAEKQQQAQNRATTRRKFIDSIRDGDHLAQQQDECLNKVATTYGLTRGRDENRILELAEKESPLLFDVGTFTTVAARERRKIWGGE